MQITDTYMLLCVWSLFTCFFFDPKIFLEVSSFFHVHNWVFRLLCSCILSEPDRNYSWHCQQLSILFLHRDFRFGNRCSTVISWWIDSSLKWYKHKWMHIWILGCFGGVFFLQRKFCLVSHVCLIHKGISSLNSFRYLKISLYIFMVELECFK